MKKKTPSILIVEDHRDYSNLLAAIVTDFGQLSYTCHQVDSLRAAYCCLQDENLAAILLDLNITDCSGINTFLKLHAKLDGRPIPVFIITAVEDEFIAGQAVRLGARAFLYKPEINHDDLRHIVRGAIERRGRGARFESRRLVKA